MLKDLLSRKSINRLLPPNKTAHIEKLLDGCGSIYVGFDATYSSLHLGHLSLIIAANILVRETNIERARPNILYIIGENTAVLKNILDFKNPANVANIINDYSSSLSKQINHIQKNISAMYNNRNAINILHNSKFFGNSQDSSNRVSDIYKNVSLREIKSLNILSGDQDDHHISDLVYPCHQALDWLYLKENYNCSIQIGGSDQEGNIGIGMKALKRMRGYQLAGNYGLMYFLRRLINPGITTKLIDNKSGQKIGKTFTRSDNYSRTFASPFVDNPYSLYQYIMRIPDYLLEDYFYQLTFMDHDCILKVLKDHKEPSSNFYAQKILANQILRICFSDKIAEEINQIIYSLLNGKINDELSENPQEILSKIKQYLPKYKIILDSNESFDKLQHKLNQKNIYIKGKRIDKEIIKSRGENLIKVGGSDFAILEVAK